MIGYQLLVRFTMTSKSPQIGPFASGFASRASEGRKIPLNSAPTPRVLGNRKDLRRAISNPRSTMLNKYRLFQRAKGVFYWQDNESGKQGSLPTKDRRAAEKLLHAKNEAHRLPTLNLTMARAYLSAHDPKMSTRTWVAVMREMGTHGIAFLDFDSVHKPSTKGMKWNQVKKTC